MTYRITLRTVLGDAPVIESATLGEAIEWARERYGAADFHCVDADVHEVDCPVCEDAGHASDGCRAVISEPLRLGGLRDEDSHLLLERIP